jgi:hypothetical protein
MILDLAPNEVQTIVNALTQRPYAEVSELIPKIIRQANTQASHSEKPEDADSED